MQLTLFTKATCLKVGTHLAIACCVFVVSACSTMTPSIPEGYSGAVAIVKDSAKQYSSSKGDFFFLSAIDGKYIDDSRSKTERTNQGRGFAMTAAIVERNIPAKTATFTLVGRTLYAAPILALTNTVYQIKGDITFSPDPYRNYVVKGQLSEDYSAVWLEDESTGKVVDKKIEIKGSAALGAFQK